MHFLHLRLSLRLATRWHAKDNRPPSYITPRTSHFTCYHTQSIPLVTSTAPTCGTTRHNTARTSAHAALFLVRALSNTSTLGDSSPDDVNRRFALPPYPAILHSIFAPTRSMLNASPARFGYVAAKPPHLNSTRILVQATS